MQLVHIVERGERSQMSKRRGDFVTLDELIDDIGVDAARFFMLERSPDTTLDLDLDLARARSQENPVYYVQYAHARIASILRNAGEERVTRRAGGRPGGGVRAAGARRAHAGQAAARAAGGGARGGRAARAAPAHGVRARRRLRLPRLLPRLPGGRRRAGRAGGLADRPLRRDAACDRPGARPARCLGAGEHVAMTLGLLAHRIRPPAGEPEGALVLLHGRGVDESDLFPLLDALDPEHRLVGATPRGPLTLPPGGFHWYIVERVGYPHRETFMQTYEALTAWLDAFAEETGIPWARTVIGGFSQGAVMSYALALAAGRPWPAGLLAMSGFIPEVEGFELDLERAGLPIAITHGTLDPIISVEFARSRPPAAGGGGKPAALPRVAGRARHRSVSAARSARVATGGDRTRPRVVRATRDSAYRIPAVPTPPGRSSGPTRRGTSGPRC